MNLPVIFELLCYLCSAVVQGADVVIDMLEPRNVSIYSKMIGVWLFGNTKTNSYTESTHKGDN